MKLLLLNTSEGLKPCYDEDYDNKKKLKLGVVYQVEIKKARNVEFHRKYFKLINLSWEYQNEGVVNHFKNNVDLFRKTVEMSAGHCDTIYSIPRNEWIETPKSISFDKMDEIEFQDLYDRVKDVLFTVFLKKVSEEEFMRNLVNF